MVELVSNLDKGTGSKLDKNNSDYKENKHRKTPVVKSVIMSFFDNIYNVGDDIFGKGEIPSWGHLIAVFYDFCSYILVPMQGGYHAPKAHTKFILDMYAYRAAGVTEMFLFKQLSNVFKDFFWKAIGMWERITKAAWDDTKGFYQNNILDDKLESK